MLFKHYSTIRLLNAKFGPAQNLVTDRSTENINQNLAHLCSVFKINHSSRTPYSLWKNGLVEVQNRNLETHLLFS